jgi:hypothetical protein
MPFRKLPAENVKNVIVIMTALEELALPLRSKSRSNIITFSALTAVFSAISVQLASISLKKVNRIKMPTVPVAVSTMRQILIHMALNGSSCPMGLMRRMVSQS